MIKNILQPTGDQVRAFRDRQTGEPIYMLNLLKFREKASYEVFNKVMKPKGAKVVYSGAVRGFLIGEGDGTWDAMVVIMYPSTQVMLDMFRNEEYQVAQQHRAAALEGQLLIECGAGFEFGA